MSSVIRGSDNFDTNSIDVKTEGILLYHNTMKTYGSSALVDQWITKVSFGNNPPTHNGTTITIQRDGVYYFDCALLCNTGNAGTNGDYRIRVNGTPIVAGYSFASDTGNWEKSTSSMVYPLSVGDTVDIFIQSTQYVWGEGNTYGHTHFSIMRIGA